MGKKNVLISKIIHLFLIAITISLLPPPAFAEIKTFVKEYTYRASDEDSRNSSRAISLREVKRLLLEELSTYIESQTEVQNFQITKDQIITLTAGIVSTEVVEDKWDGKVYWLKAKIAANPHDVINSIGRLRKDREKVKELEELRKYSEELLQENKRLNKELKIATGAKKQEAVQAYKRNIEILRAYEWLEIGDALLISGNNTEAVKSFSKAIELNPQDEKGYRFRGIAYRNLGNYQQALKDYSKAIELNTQDAMIYVIRGLTYLNLGDNQKAIIDYSKAIELNPQATGAHLGRAMSYVALGNYQQALKDYNKEVELNPQEVGTYALRGNLYLLKLGNYQQSIRDYNKAIELNPRQVDVYFHRGIAYQKLGDDQKALKDYSKVIELDPSRAGFYCARGRVYEKLGDNQQALKDYSKAIELDPKEASPYFIRGGIYLKLGNNEQAMTDLKIAARLGLKLAQDLLRSQGIEW
jgi:tetratricopeptide (TPR) repeat protein